MLSHVHRFAIKSQHDLVLQGSKQFAAQITVLETLESAKQVAIANVHLEGAPDAETVRLHQIQQVLDQVAALQVPHVIIAGDYNCGPTSSVYAAMSQQFKSALNENGEPEYTFFTPEIKVTMDFIFVKQLQVHQKSVMTSKDFVPNAVIPSDHLALFASFKW